MEELLPYAVLIRGVICDGFPFGQMYEDKLHALFLAEPDNPDYLELELMGGDLPKAICYLWAHINWNKFDQTRFGRALMDLIRPVYHSMDIRSFGSWAYCVWESLPGGLQNTEPFFSLCYADDPLSWGDEAQSRGLYEKMLSFYDSPEAGTDGTEV